MNKYWHENFFRQALIVDKIYTNLNVKDRSTDFNVNGRYISTIKIITDSHMVSRQKTRVYP